LPPKRLGIELRGVRRIRDRRIVDEHHQRLTLDVKALVVVPVVLGRDDPVADEDELGVVEGRVFRHVLGPRHDVVFPLERLPLRSLAQYERGRGRRDANERHFLNVGSVRVAGLEPDFRELID